MVQFASHVAVTFRVREIAEVAYAPAPSAAPVPDPSPDAEVEALEELEEEIAVLAAHLHAGQHRLLTLVAEFDRRRGWEMGGHRTCAHWLSFRTGIDLGACREKVRAARALVDLPLTSASMGRGELSFSAVRALTRVARPENEADLLELARGATTAELERMVRGFKLGSRKDEAGRERERIESRELSLFPDEDGMVVVRGQLTPEVGALLMRAVEAAGDSLYREKGPSERVSAETSRESAQRRADALGLVAERALAAGFGGSADEGEASVPLSGARAERYQVLLPRSWRSAMPGTDRCSMWAGGPAPYRRPSEGLSRPGTGAAAFPAAGSGSPTRTTYATGRTGARRRSTTCCSCAPIITGWCTRRGGASSRGGGGRTAGRPSSTPADRSTTAASARRHPSFRPIRWLRSATTTADAGPSPTSSPPAHAGSARPTSRAPSTSAHSRPWGEGRGGRRPPHASQPGSRPPPGC